MRKHLGWYNIRSDNTAIMEMVNDNMMFFSSPEPNTSMTNRSTEPSDPPVQQIGRTNTQSDHIITTNDCGVKSREKIEVNIHNLKNINNNEPNRLMERTTEKPKEKSRKKSENHTKSDPINSLANSSIGRDNLTNTSEDGVCGDRKDCDDGKNCGDEWDKSYLVSVVERLTHMIRENNTSENLLLRVRDMIDQLLANRGGDNSDDTAENYDYTTVGSRYLNNHNENLAKYDITIRPTQTYVRNFLRTVIGEIKHRTNEKLPKSLNLDQIIKNISESLPKNIELDNFYSYVSEYLIAKSSYHHYYDLMASHIEVKRLHSITSESFLTTAHLLQQNLDKKKRKSPILAPDVYAVILKNHERLQQAIKYDRDYLIDFFGMKTLERSYLYKLHFTKFKYIERPQHLFMRVALGIHGSDIDSAVETYNLMSQKFFTHATPTLFNAGTKRPQMSSCFLHAIDDNIESIMSAVKDMAMVSKWSGGIGVHLSSLRARGSLIRGTNGLASGIIPLCILLNDLAKYINQGGKRNGSIACYLEPWHPDIFDFCDLRKNTGNSENRARDLFLALWVPSLFIKRVKEDAIWSLMCPDDCPGLNLVHGEEFNKLYEKYESEQRYIKQVSARELWKYILETQSETGFPYILYKDNANAKSNQKNLGTIRSSNLCAEIIQYSDDNETAVCNLSSICLPMFITVDMNGKKVFDHDKLMYCCRVIVRNINKIIDCNYYPTPKTKRSNMRHRPMGIGVQGLADVYNMMGMAFDSVEAYKINREIFESIYYACIDESKELAKKLGPYQSFKGSPSSEGLLQFHMWGRTEYDLYMGYDWKRLIEEVKRYGLRNSLLTALMPTASTSQIMGNSECIEPYMSNIFKRSTLAGEFIVVNKNLMKDLINLDLWDDDMRKRLIIENGSIQNIDMIPEKIKEIYKTAFELKQMHLVRQSVARGIFIDQSQSFNLFLKEPDFDILTSALIEGHDLGIKTGIYYYRSLPAINPINFGIDVDDIKRLTGNDTSIDMISKSYNMDEDESNSSQTNRLTTDDGKGKKKNIKKHQTVQKNDGLCKSRPGVKISDCISCGS
jgi:ribonucleoside-diphosphate reductase alpha chain